MIDSAWAGVVATLLAVIVALLKEEIVGIWRKPKLTPSISLHAPDCVKTSLTSEAYTLRAQGISSIECYYFRVWVKNDGNRRAQKVQVYGAKLFTQDSDGTFREMRDFLPMNFVWSHSQPGCREILADISPSMGRHCDLGYIADPSKRALLGDVLPNLQVNETIFHLELEIRPNTRSHLLPSGQYRLELHVGAANRQPEIMCIEINHSGAWYCGESRMFSEGVTIRQVNPPCDCS